MNAVSLQPRLASTANFSPRLQHAVRLLQMSTLDYKQALREVALDNPFLEVEGAEPAPGADEGPATSEADAEIEWARGLDRLAGDGPPALRHLSHDESLDVLQRTPVRASLAAHLRAQLGTLRLDRRERLFAELMVEALDDDGYLRVSLEDLAADLGDEDPARAIDELRAALVRVQALDPAGVAARGVAECLSLQLRDVADPQLRALAGRIVSDHLELLATRRLSRLAVQLGASERATRAAVDCILGLDPRPGARHDDTHAQAIVPDVVVHKVGDAWRTALNDRALPRVRLHQSYAALFERHRAQGDVALKDCLEQARWTVQNAAQRVATILDVATAIVARQTLFLDYGHLAMKPLGLREIADAVGVHPSTVSRAVHHKYLATPHGVFELHRFFSRGMAHTSGGASAPAALQALIRELIGAERPHTPLSDAALARELAQQGFLIARRTVTKYRQGLNIEAVERRRLA
ncbi:RNA polymerase factor sigma-54 [Variovorax sp. PvP013]|uniref:RNA polymerase factor sigma-54 n=1 Tax=Variovorax sp. PvP013 TaxID=3156435 RepID=UPI003D1E1FD9